MNTGKKIISLLMCMLMVLTMVPMSVFAAEATEIDTVHIEGLPVPLYGQTVEEYYTAILDERGGGTLTVNDEAFDNKIGKYGNLFDEGLEVKKNDTVLSSTSTELITEGNYYVAMTLYPADGYAIPADVDVTVDGAVSVEKDFDEYGSLIAYAKFEVKATKITSVELTVSGYQCGGYTNQITFTGSEGTYMIPSTYPVFTDINDFEGTALGKYDGFCRDTEYWVSAAFAAADGYTLPELSKDDITLKGFTVLDKYVSYDATEQIIWVAFKLSAHSFDDDSDNTCNLCNKERYTYTEADGKVTITAYNGLGGAVNIPSTIGGYPVTVIGEEAFCENYGITSVSIPDSVTTIEEEAFYGNELTSVHIGKGVTSIGEDAFAFSEKFETITVDEDNDYYLSENNVLFDIDKEELIVYAVKKTDTSFTVPATVKKIHRAAFNFAKNLKSITISDGVTDIGSFAFAGCDNITSLIIPNSVTSIGSYAFSQMANLKYVIISDKLTTVSSDAFQYCSKLTDVVIPASVTSIEGGAFRYCPSLSDIYYTGTQAQWENVAVNNNAGYHDKFLSANVHYNAQVVDGHVYDNDCDAECNLCTEIRTAPHAYDNACDAECNNCPATRTPANHTGGTATCIEKAKCSVCGEAYGSLKAHTYKNVTTKATLSADGKIESKCSVCGDVESTEKIAKVKSVTLSKDNYTYSGKAKNPTVNVTDADDTVLVKDTDYRVTFNTDRKAIGKHTVSVKFKGNYSGSKTLVFFVLPKAPANLKVEQKTKTLNINWDKVTGADGYRVYVYKGTKQVFAKNTTKTEYTVTDLTPGTKYEVRVKAYIKDGTEREYAEKYASVDTCTKPSKVSISSVTAGTKQATVKWKERNCTGYQIRYSTSKSFSSYDSVRISGEDNVSKVIKSLKSGKTYYFKVRAYKSVDGVRYYGSFSDAKSVKIK